jgi:hypothetical protein
MVKQPTLTFDRGYDAIVAAGDLELLADNGS